MGLREVASSLGCSKSTILRWLTYLETTERVRTEAGTRGTLVTILNWNVYQNFEEEGRDTSGTDASSVVVQARVHDGPLIKKVRRKNISPVYTEEFELAYNQYARREGKADGFKSYQKLSAEQRGQLTVAIRNYSEQVRREKRERRFIKQFSAFMSSWQDYEVDSQTTAGLVQTKPSLDFGEESL